MPRVAFSRLLPSGLLAVALALGGAGRAPADGPDVAAAPGGIQWFPTLAGARRAAAATGRPILFLAAAPHCGGVPGVW